MMVEVERERERESERERYKGNFKTSVVGEGCEGQFDVKCT